MFSAPTSDFITSTLSGAIAAGDATATIGTGLDLPATNGILQIDYDSTTALGADNGPETIAYATYTTGTGALAGMTRGLNGTTGVAHANGAKVQCGPSASYWGSGSILAADIGAVLLNANLATTAGEPGGAWKAWTPALTNWTVGANAVDAKYIQIGKTIMFRLYWKFGAGAAVGSAPTFTFPITSISYPGTAQLQTLGSLSVLDAGTANYFGIVVWMTTTTALLQASVSDSAYVKASTFTANVPMTWTTNDELFIQGAYEVA